MESLTARKTEETRRQTHREGRGREGKGGEGRLLFISCWCAETCFLKTQQPAASFRFTDGRRTRGHEDTLLLSTCARHNNKLLKQPPLRIIRYSKAKLLILLCFL